jgi:phytoene dehydrogenase-like protein
VAGVLLEQGQQVQASRVISNADALETFERLVGAEHLPAPYVRRLRRMHPSLSACVLYAATDLDLTQHDATHETFVFRHWDHDQTYEDILHAKPGGMWLTIPTLDDPSVAPAGQHLVVLTSLAAYDAVESWEQEKERFTELMIDEVDSVYPGFREHVTFADLGTPMSLERYTRNQRGAIYGWAYTPEQAGSRRLSHETPVEGLFLSGHWTQPGSASIRVFASGIHTAVIVLMSKGVTDAIPSFAQANLPSMS